jgi:hypothetical protein
MHVGSHLRDASAAWVAAGMPADLPTRHAKSSTSPRGGSVSRLIGALWRCSDVMPSGLRADFGETVHRWGAEECWTYLQGARALRRARIA